MKHLLILSMLVVLAFVVIGCNSPTGNGTPNGSGNVDFELTGTSWKLTGIVDSETGSLTELEPRDCEECYTLTFDTDTTISSYSSVNEMSGDYSVDYETKSISILKFGGTKINERGDGNLWWRIFIPIETFSFIENELRLYYTENRKQKYLLFSRN